MSIYRVGASHYADAARSVKNTIIADTVAAGETKFFIPARDRHTLWVRNTGTTELRLSSESSVKNYLTLAPGEKSKFDIHYAGFEEVDHGVLRQIYHCEWDDAVYVTNPSGVAGAVEMYEVA